MPLKKREGGGNLLLLRYFMEAGLLHKNIRMVKYLSRGGYDNKEKEYKY